MLNVNERIPNKTNPNISNIKREKNFEPEIFCVRKESIESNPIKACMMHLQGYKDCGCVGSFVAGNINKGQMDLQRCATRENGNANGETILNLCRAWGL